MKPAEEDKHQQPHGFFCNNKRNQASKAKPSKAKAMKKYASEAEVRAALLSNRGYNPGMIAGLEDYVEAACANAAPYVFDAVRTLVKLYQIFPDHSGNHAQQNISRCCCLAFLHNSEGDDTDLLALRYLIPPPSSSNVLHNDEQEDEEPILSTIYQCAEAATACRFAEFWKHYDALLSHTADPAIAAMARRAQPAQQRAVLGMLALSYQEAPLDAVLRAVRANAAADLEQLQSPAVQSVSVDANNSQTVSFQRTADNTQRQRAFVEGATFPTVHALLAKKQMDNNNNNSAQ